MSTDAIVRRPSREASARRLLARVKVLLLLVMVALPVTLSSQASAASTARATSASVTPCVMQKPATPIDGGRDWWTGKKNVTYKVTVNCPLSATPIYVQVQQRFYEWDSSGSEPAGSQTSYQVLVFGGSHTFSVTKPLPDTEGGNEEMWQKARMAWVKSLPLPTSMPYGGWAISGQASISN